MEHICDPFQSTPPRGGRPSIMANIPMGASVSIHAPARGATEAERSLEPSFWVSIHAPARGATRPWPSRGRRSVSFNPRPRAGGDLVIGDKEIPAPPFQSTPPRGGRPRAIFVNNDIFRPFQSTPPRGGRPPVWLNTLTSNARFNPRPRAGGDHPGTRYQSSQSGFQSTPPRGGRPVPI